MRSATVSRRSSIHPNPALRMYDVAGRLIGEYDSVGKVKQETLWLNDLPAAVVK